jgi:hypothetical protein
MTPPFGGQPQTEDLGSRLEDIVTAAWPHLMNGEIRKIGSFRNSSPNTRKLLQNLTRSMGGLKKYITVYIRTTPDQFTATEENTRDECSGCKERCSKNATTWVYRRIREPVVLVRKKKGELRLCVVYRKHRHEETVLFDGPDRLQPGLAGRSQMVFQPSISRAAIGKSLYTRMTKRRLRFRQVKCYVILR